MNTAAEHGKNNKEAGCAHYFHIICMIVIVRSFIFKFTSVSLPSGKGRGFTIVTPTLR